MANGNMAYSHASSSNTTDDTDKQPWFPGPSDVDHGQIQEMADADLETLREVTPKIVVVVHDAEKKFSSAALDIAINSHATAEGDTILVLAFMEKFVCDFGTKMIADVETFRGANLTAIVKAVGQAKTVISSLCQRHSLMCQKRKIKLLIKVVPGSNPWVLVAKEISDFQATCAIFDKNIITKKNKEFYTKKLSCTILQIGSDSRSVETISSFSQAVPAIENTSVMPRRDSVSSSERSMELNSPSSASPSMFSKMLKSLGGSKRSTGHHRDSCGGSSRTTSSLGSSRFGVQEEDESDPEEDYYLQ